MAKSSKTKSREIPAAAKAAIDRGMKAPSTAAAGTAPNAAQVCTSLGAATWLATRSPLHRHLFIADLEWLILPPIMLNQTRLYHDEQKPLAFVAWAFLNETVEMRIAAGVPRLQPQDWKSGDRPWIIETIAPFAKEGGVEEIIKELTGSVFGGKRPRVVGERT